MRYVCHFCGKSVTSDLSGDSVIRAMLVCPECLEKGEVTVHGTPIYFVEVSETAKRRVKPSTRDSLSPDP